MYGESGLFLATLRSMNKIQIPVYQRNYDWKESQCERLFDDLERLVRRHQKNHFFGSLVICKKEKSGIGNYEIIDGQQRITTISLLLLALCHLMEEGALVVENEYLQNKVMETCLIYPYVEERERIRLVPVKDDRKAYEALFKDYADRVPDSNMTMNYKYLKNRMRKSGLTADEIFGAVGKLVTVNITLDRDDDAQLIFESLNSTGLNLSEGDKIRNFLLMGLPSERQERYYDEYWHPLEENVRYNVDVFIRDYLSLKLSRIPTFNNIYEDFKLYVEMENPEDIEDLLKELLEASRRYAVLLGETDYGDELDRCLFRLNRLGTSVIRPYLLEVFRFMDEGRLSRRQVTDICLALESYIFRRLICDIPTNALSKLFVSLHKEILRLDAADGEKESADRYVEKLLYILSRKRERSKFPMDEEFMTSLANKNIYDMLSKNRKYYFERMENYGTIETKDVWTQLETGAYSIEHIMPQTLTEKWRNDLRQDGDPEAIQEKWLHKAANLTLTGYNSNYSNSPFAEKRDVKCGFRDSGLRMNQWIGRQERWSVPQLEARTRELTEKALEIWPYPETDYEPANAMEDFILLSDDVDVTGKGVTTMIFRGAEQPVGTWVEMYQKVLRELYSEHPDFFRRLAVSRSEETPDCHFSTEQDYFRFKRPIGEDMYVFTDNNTKTKLYVLQKIFEMLDIDADNLAFAVKEYGKDSGEDEE